MELNPATLKGTMEQFDNHTYYRIENAEFAGITVLGNDVEPCFKSAGFLNAYSAMVSAYANFMESIHNNEEGGISQMEDINEIQVDEVVETEAAEEVVETEEVAEVETVELPEEEVVEEAAAEEVVVEEATEVPAEETPAEETVFEEKEDEEVCPECGKNPCVCENSCNDKDEKYSLLEQEYAELKAKYESLTNEHNATLEALKKYSRNEKLEIISKFSTKLEDSEELIANLTENVDNLTEEEIKAELGTALVDQITAEEEEAPVEETNNFSLNLNLNPEVRNDAWSLVDAYKNRK